MKRYAGIFTLVMSSFYSFAQQPLHVNVDPVCMDRYEYHINTAESTGTEYISYRIRQSNNEFIFLDVATESTGMQLSMPESVDCRNVKFSSQYVDKINAGQAEVYIVRKGEVGYNISRVTSASYHSKQGNTLQYKAYGLDFFANLENASSGANLAQASSKSELYYAGDEMSGCLKEHHFRKVPLETCKPNIDFDYVPEIGMVREVTRISQMNDKEYFLNLVRINDVSLDTYMSKACEGKANTMAMPSTYAVETTNLSGIRTGDAIVMDGQAYYSTDASTSNYTVIGTYVDESSAVNYTEENTILTSSESATTNAIPTDYAYQNVVITEKSGAVKPKNTMIPAKKMVKETTATTPVATPTVVMPVVAIKCANIANKNEHLIQQGETLYGIARKYNTTVEELKLWNKLVSNNINPCNTLKVVAAPAPAQEIEKKVVVKTEAPKAYEQTSKIEKFTKRGATEALVEKSETVTNSIEHTVIPGETISGLARKYGYTEERFRTMNNLGSSDALRVGQTLRLTDCACPIPAAYEAPQRKFEAAKVETLVARGVSDNTLAMRKVSAKAAYKRMTVHVVQDNETLQDIATSYKIELEDLLAINGFEANDILVPNQRLFVD